MVVLTAERREIVAYLVGMVMIVSAAITEAPEQADFGLILIGGSALSRGRP